MGEQTARDDEKICVPDSTVRRVCVPRSFWLLKIGDPKPVIDFLLGTLTD